jgi:hypothetical protein
MHKKIRGLILFFITFISIVTCNQVIANPAIANFTPPIKPPGRTRAQGTRGCPLPQGELSLYGIKNEADGEEISSLEINAEQPTILLKVDSRHRETVLITVTNIVGKLERTEVLRRELTASGDGYLAVNLTGLEAKSERLLLTVLLLCDGRPQYAKVAKSWINLSEGETETNRFIASENVQIVDEKPKTDF